MEKAQVMTNKKIVWTALGYFTLISVAVILYIKFYPADISKAGATGDAFNGLLTPFISFAGAILVFLSFRAQIRANLIITSQWQFDLLLKTLNDVQESYEKIIVAPQPGQRRATEPSSYKGESALSAIAREDWNLMVNVPDATTDFHTLLLEFRFVIDRIEKAQIEDKDFLHLRSSVFYFRKLAIPMVLIRDRIIRDNLGNELPAIIRQVDLLQERVFKLQKSGAWGQ